MNHTMKAKPPRAEAILRQVFPQPDRFCENCGNNLPSSVRSGICRRCIQELSADERTIFYQIA